MNPLLVAAALAPLLPDVIKGVERLFPKGTGQTKLDTVAAMAKLIVGQLATGGLLPALPDDKTIRDAVEATVAKLNQAGELKGAQTVAGSAAPYSGMARELIDTALHNLSMAQRLLGAAA